MSSIAPEDSLPTPQRRIRHIRSIQIQNLTPFPARDALTHNLTQPGPSMLQPVDDIELTMARRRRRISSSSVVTVFSNTTEEDVYTSPGMKKQVRSGSRGSLQGAKPASFVSTPRPRTRTNSRPSPPQVSRNTNQSAESSTAPLSTLFVTHSQRVLEEIVSSRLVETFVTLTLEPSGSLNEEEAQAGSSSHPNSPATTAKGRDSQVKRATSASAVNHRRGVSASTTSTTPSAGVRLNRSHSVQPTSPATFRSKLSPSNGPLSRPSSATTSNFPSPPPTPPPGASRTKTLSSTSSVSHNRQTSREQAVGTSGIPIPVYMSPIHTPSINPSFDRLDPEREFAPWADITGSRLKLSVWGRKVSTTSYAKGDSKRKGKGKENAPQTNSRQVEDIPEWRILDEWEVDLDEMKPFSPKPGQDLPSNTLLLTLSSGDTFQIPPVSSRKTAISRPPSPVAPGYSSEGEAEGSRHQNGGANRKEAKKREQEVLAKSRRETRMKKSATWQDLVKLVNIQTALVDTRELLEEVVQTCDFLLEDDGYLASLRECSERDEWILRLRSEKAEVVKKCQKAREDLVSRRQTLEERRKNLKAAHALSEIRIGEQKNRTIETYSERKLHGTLVSSLTPLRANLIQEVTFIFPIEPLSAPDLLFTILGVPLPVPVAASDPAPPPLLPDFPDVNEDNTATALGYVAQVLQHISAYLGSMLVYPVTCCGSRSVIKDPISAMMGPRTFPLYSKGVETYRYEYGVFLLNKNIEMLMSERNLRAMDIRHTLPNLKNLLLTLTTGEEVEPSHAFKTTPIRSPIRTISPLALDAQVQSTEEPPSPPVPAPRRSAPFLSPLAAILRARYPSSIGRPSVNVVDEVPEPKAPEESPNTSTNNPAETST